MQQVHDERRIALQPEGLTARESKFFRLMAWLGLREKNQRDEKVAKARVNNEALRIAEWERQARQPGVPEDVAAHAAQMLARVGRGAA